MGGTFQVIFFISQGYHLLWSCGVVDLIRSCYKEVDNCNIYSCIICKKKQLQVYNIKGS